MADTAPTPATAPTTREVVAAAITDVVVVVLFVLIGRRSHHEEGSVVAETAKVLGPFLIALLLGWLAARAWRSPMSPATGIVIWLVTAAGGMVIRRLVFQRSTALAFVIVGSVFLLAIPAWRFVREWWVGRRAGATK